MKKFFVLLCILFVLVGCNAPTKEACDIQIKESFLLHKLKTEVRGDKCVVTLQVGWEFKRLGFYLDYMGGKEGYEVLKTDLVEVPNIRENIPFEFQFTPSKGTKTTNGRVYVYPFDR